MTEQALHQIESKLHAYVGHVQKLREATAAAQQDLQSLLLELDAKDAEIESLKAQLQNRNIAGAVAGNLNTDTHAAKAKIAEMMREIDRCIALLNV